jgi:hypothetical protein
LVVAPVIFKTWIGGFVGPSYEVELIDGELTYRVFERGYDVHNTETFSPNDSDWRRFRETVDRIDLWSWAPVYNGESLPDATTWFIHLKMAAGEVTSTGINLYPPLFVDYMHAVRDLLGGRHFA